MIAVVMAFAGQAEAIEFCSGGNRTARKVTCLVDADTGWERGVKWRLLDIDTPEISRPECRRELEIGNQATERLRQLMAGGYSIEDSGQKDRTSDRRALVRITLPDGRDAGQLLISEGLAQPWPNKGNKWCSR
ncbi:MAG TPA: thermonuclease family protein [Pseudorhizobium sp.]|jgi:endonuclease YncB( thermonuclease family)|nr:thermonuclease family protein [Pseudorhizobium sp.]